MQLLSVHARRSHGRMSKGNYIKVAAALLAASLLVPLLRERFNRSADAGRDTTDVNGPTTREVDAVEGEERTDRTTEREDELRVQRTEEELRAGTREREAGEVGVHKTVHTDREQVEVPTRREEVSRSEEHTSELQSRQYLVCRLLLEKKK